MQDILRDRGKPFFQVVGRLKTGIDRSQAQANLQTIASSLQQEFPDANAGHTISAQPITTALFSSTGGEAGAKFVSAVLLAIVGLVLIIACSNVANLLMARAVKRQQEIAVRLAIGASRARLFRQLITESFVLAIFGGAVGLGVGYEGCRFLWSFRPPDVARNLADPKLDSTVFVFAFLLSIVTAFIFGVMPSLRASKTDLVNNLKEDSHLSAPSAGSARLQKVLLGGQVALSLVSLVAASLFFRAVQHAYTIDPGFDENHLAVFMMNPEHVGYDAVQLQAFHRDVKDRVSGLPGIAAATWASNMPFWSSASRSVSIEGQEQKRKSEMLNTVTNTVDVDYFNVMHIPILDGRDFSDGDRDGSLPVVIINEDLARRYWPGGDAIGKRLRLAGDSVTRQVIGVVKNSNYTTLGEAPQPCIYLPLRQNPGATATLYVRAARDPGSVLGEVQREVKALAPKVEISDIRTGRQIHGPDPVERAHRGQHARRLRIARSHSGQRGTVRPSRISGARATTRNRSAHGSWRLATCHSVPGSATRHGPRMRWGRDRLGALTADQPRAGENAVWPQPCRPFEFGRRFFGADPGGCPCMLFARTRGQQDGSHGRTEKGIGFTLDVARRHGGPTSRNPRMGPPILKGNYQRKSFSSSSPRFVPKCRHGD